MQQEGGGGGRVAIGNAVCRGLLWNSWAVQPQSVTAVMSSCVGSVHLRPSPVQPGPRTPTARQGSISVGSSVTVAGCLCTMQSGSCTQAMLLPDAVLGHVHCASDNGIPVVVLQVTCSDMAMSVGQVPDGAAGRPRLALNTDCPLIAAW